MKALIKIQNLIPSLPVVGIFEPVIDDADQILYPIILGDNYYHLRIKGGNIWNAIGLQDDICTLIGNIIEHELYSGPVAGVQK